MNSLGLYKCFLCACTFLASLKTPVGGGNKVTEASSSTFNRRLVLWACLPQSHQGTTNNRHNYFYLHINLQAKFLTSPEPCAQFCSRSPTTAILDFQ